MYYSEYVDAMANLFHPERKNWTKAEKVNVRSFSLAVLVLGALQQLKILLFYITFLVKSQGKVLQGTL